MPCNAVDYDCSEIEAHCAQMDVADLPCTVCPFWQDEQIQSRVSVSLEEDNLNLEGIPF